MSILLVLSGLFLVFISVSILPDPTSVIPAVMGILNIAAAVRIRRYQRQIAMLSDRPFNGPAAPAPAAPAGIPSVDDMTGVQFEEFCARILEGYGFVNISKTPVTGDHGIDLLAWKGGKKYAIQCKRYKKNVNNKAIQEAYTGKQLYAAAEAVVMTSSDFTGPAKKEAAEVGVTLWNRDNIKHIMSMAGINDVRI